MPTPTTCQSPDDRLLKDLIQRVKALEAAFGPWRALVGSDTTAAQSIVVLLSSEIVPVGDNFTFDLTWQSSPGMQYQVQTSEDGITWTTLGSPIPAAADPAITTSWTSPEYGIGDTPLFRVRRFPVAFAPCPA